MVKTSMGTVWTGHTESDAVYLDYRNEHGSREYASYMTPEAAQRLARTLAMSAAWAIKRQHRRAKKDENDDNLERRN